MPQPTRDLKKAELHLRKAEKELYRLTKARKNAQATILAHIRHIRDLIRQLEPQDDQGTLPGF